ncbi:MAG: LuxR C-terminal-related transcriptional regulator [Novosphingobium sp.]
MKSGNDISGMGPQVAIASPLDVWSAGIEAILREGGWGVAGHWPDMEHLRWTPSCADADALILANCLVDRPGDVSPYRPETGDFAGNLILAIDPAYEFLVDDFVALDVEGILLTTASRYDVLDCIENVMNGRRWVDPGVRSLLGQGMNSGQVQDRLSTRELEVARLAAKGLSNKHIARELEVSDGTIKMHMHHILSKLNLTSRVELMRPASATFS